MPLRGNDLGIGHYKLQEQCGLCGFIFDIGDRIAALILETNGNTTYKVLDASFFPVDPYKHRFDGKYFCRNPFCGICSMQPETATFHVDCYNLFLQLATRPERLARLYRVATSRFPWRRYVAHPLETPRDEDSIISNAAKFLCFDSLERLPYDVKVEICKFLYTGVSRRLDIVQRVTHDMPTEAGEWLNSVPLAHVQYWQRGEPPVLQNHAAISPRRLVMDFQGIRIIESSAAPARNGRPGAELYVVAAPAHFECDFRYGTCRLTDLRSGEKPRVWNVPNPPRLEDCKSNFSSDRIPDYLAATDLSACFGVTFFNVSGETIRIHAHTQSQPTAEEVYKRIYRSVRSLALWIYVPLPPRDSLTGFGFTSHNGNRRFVNHCFRTSLTGDFTVGPWCHPNEAVYTVDEISAQSTLIHDLEDPTDIWTPHRFSHTYPDSDACTDFSPVAPHSQPPLTNGCFSSARLDSVRRVWIYRCKNGRFCKGLIIDYVNGAQRALGSCAVGVIPAECCADFRHIRFCLVPESSDNETRVNAPSVIIDVSPKTDNESQDEGWTRFVEGAILEVWFDCNSMFMCLFQGLRWALGL